MHRDSSRSDVVGNIAAAHGEGVAVESLGSVDLLLLGATSIPLMSGISHGPVLFVFVLVLEEWLPSTNGFLECLLFGATMATSSAVLKMKSDGNAHDMRKCEGVIREVPPVRAGCWRSERWPASYDTGLDSQASQSRFFCLQMDSIGPWTEDRSRSACLMPNRNSQCQNELTDLTISLYQPALG